MSKISSSQGHPVRSKTQSTFNRYFSLFLYRHMVKQSGPLIWLNSTERIWTLLTKGLVSEILLILRRSYIKSHTLFFRPQMTFTFKSFLYLSMAHSWHLFPVLELFSICTWTCKIMSLSVTSSAGSGERAGAALAWFSSFGRPQRQDSGSALPDQHRTPSLFLGVGTPESLKPYLPNATLSIVAELESKLHYFSYKTRITSPPTS